MPKGFLVKRLEGMSVLESVPYRPWCEGENDGPVDFSLKAKKSSAASESTDIRSQLFVRTPDSGFSSPSEGEFAKKQNNLLRSPVGRSYSSFYQKNPLASEEQTVPLALVKKKKVPEEEEEEEDVGTSLSPKPVRSSFNFNDSFLSLGSPNKDANFLLSSQANALHLLSSTLYWSHGSGSINAQVPLNPLAYDLSITENSFGNLSETPPRSRATTSPLAHSTPNKTPPRSPEITVASPIKRKTPSCAVTPEKKSKSLKKTKTSRKLNFDEDKTSPVSGTIIRQLEEGEEPLVVRKGDIDPAYNVVEITEEAKAELSKIENKIGAYVCRLCKELYDDAFGLAQHRCSRIIHVEYRCPECDKVFNCPANLASHRRWHKPKGTLSLMNSGNSSSSKGVRGESACDLTDSRKSSIDVPHDDIYNNNNNNNNVSTLNNNNNNNSNKTGCSDNRNSSEPPDLIPLPDLASISSSEDTSEQYECPICSKRFKRQSYLRKHLTTHNQPSSDEGQREPTTSPMGLRSPHEKHPLFQSPPPHIMAPLLSPPFSESVFRCRLCSATFFTPAALQLHSSTIHGGSDPQSLVSPPLSMPMSTQFTEGGGLLSPSSLYSPYPFLPRSSQISAPS